MADAYRPAQAQIRRFRLDPASFAPMVFRSRLVFCAFLVAAYLLAASILGVATDTSLSTWLPLGGGLALFSFITLVTSRQAAASIAYELIVSSRVLHRVHQGRVAEVLRPEVTGIVDTPKGLWLVCSSPARSLFVIRAIDGFADVREAIRDWAPIEEVRGYKAWLRARRENRRQGPRDAVMGTALASDASLVGELEGVRAASLERRLVPMPVAPKKWGKRVLLLWVLLVAMFLAIWQVLQPSPRASRTLTDADCAGPCASNGLCKAEGHTCVATDEGCRRSTNCDEMGQCKAVSGRCAAGGDADCESSERCTEHGACSASAGRCVVQMNADCEKSMACSNYGLCKAIEGECVAGANADCARSALCKKDGRCTAAYGKCVTGR